ncbi:hypothetical protein EDB84DRAFT_1565201 [Lactarius hengduanensis]|nr:hypothetical protein EDB84DRAFT_1565201 [Lactarius hengduanensis]
MSIEGTKHHQLSSTDAKWAVFLPNNGTIFFGPPMDIVIANMILEGRCFEVIRREIIDAFPQEDSRWCASLLREVVLCRADVVEDSWLGPTLRVGDQAVTSQSQGNE